MSINIIELRALRGPNRYSRDKTIFMLLDIGEFEQKPSDKIPNFTDRLIKLLPSLKEHRCSIGEEGGFILRLREGTFMAHIIEHIAIELQCLAGMEVAYGKTTGTKEKGIYVVVFRYLLESAGLQAAHDAVNLVLSVINNEIYDLPKVILNLKKLYATDKLGPSTQSILDEAAKRGIPHIQLNRNSFVQLGYGKYQKWIQASMTSETSALAIEVTDKKSRTKKLLVKSGIFVPKGMLAASIDEARICAEKISFPVVLKPDVGNHGRGIYANINDFETLEFAFNIAKKIYPYVLIEEYLVGNDYRILIIDGKFIAAACREPAFVIGDGELTISQLIDKVNEDPLRGFGHENILTKINIDDITKRILEKANIKLTDVLEKGKKLYLKTTANLSQGGVSVDVTDIIHPEIQLMAERAAQIVRLDCAGIDLIAESISKPLNAQKAGIIEINAAPGFRMHLQPVKGTLRNVAKPFVDMLFKPEVFHNLPIVAVTGTNGKTTTCNLIAHTLKYAGKKVGLANTSGIEIDGIPITYGDYSGPEGHSVILREPTVDHAVLEVARGGILRRGLLFHKCDVGVILNVNSDHIGNDLVETVEELALVKSCVTEIVKENGFSVLNADDENVMEIKERARGRHILFSLDPDKLTIKKHVEEGGIAVLLCDNDIVIRTKYLDTTIASTLEVPITFDGIAAFNISNTLAAAAALHGLGLNAKMIRSGITTFYPSTQQNPGRMNLFDFSTFKVIIDYGHNKPAIEALGAMLPKLAQGRKIVICHGVGNRQDDSIKKFAAALAKVYDYVIITDLDIRQRKLGETAAVVREGLLESGFNDKFIKTIMDVHSAVEHAFEIVQKDDLIVIQVDQIQPVIDQVSNKKKGSLIRLV